MKILISVLTAFTIIVLISGCMDKEEATISETDPESGIHAQTLIINQSDIPGLSLVESYFMAIPRSSSYDFGDGDDSGIVPGMEKYVNSLPEGTRPVGQFSDWSEDQKERSGFF